MRDYCRERCAFVLASLAQAPGLLCVPPDAGMFMLIDVRGTGLSGYDFMRELYRLHGVSVLDGGAFGKGTAGFIRLCFTTDESRCARDVRASGASLRACAEGGCMSDMGSTWRAQRADPRCWSGPRSRLRAPGSR